MKNVLKKQSVSTNSINSVGLLRQLLPLSVFCLVHVNVFWVSTTLDPVFILVQNVLHFLFCGVKHAVCLSKKICGVKQ